MAEQPLERPDHALAVSHSEGSRTDGKTAASPGQAVQPAAGTTTGVSKQPANAIAPKSTASIFRKALLLVACLAILVAGCLCLFPRYEPH